MCCSSYNMTYSKIWHIFLHSNCWTLLFLICIAINVCVPWHVKFVKTFIFRKYLLTLYLIWQVSPCRFNLVWLKFRWYKKCNIIKWNLRLNISISYIRSIKKIWHIINNKIDVKMVYTILWLNLKLFHLHD